MEYDAQCTCRIWRREGPPTAKPGAGFPILRASTWEMPHHIALLCKIQDLELYQKGCQPSRRFWSMQMGVGSGGRESPVGLRNIQ